MPYIILVGKGDKVIAFKVDVTDEAEKVTGGTTNATGGRQDQNFGVLSRIGCTPGFGTVSGGINTDVNSYFDSRLSEDRGQLLLDPLHAIVGSQQNRNLGMFYWHAIPACTN
ncbi:hypothetical protein D3C84_765920 [compost metagenome]